MTGATSGMGALFRKQVLVGSKFLLGLWGIVIVLLSVSTSVALCSLCGVKVVSPPLIQPGRIIALSCHRYPD